jgi:hypothetical protein
LKEGITGMRMIGRVLSPDWRSMDRVNALDIKLPQVQLNVVDQSVDPEQKGSDTGKHALDKASPEDGAKPLTLRGERHPITSRTFCKPSGPAARLL